ncbi:MAG: M43 family zinc metalloprotease, partial [Flavobacteriales bacterium]
LRQNQSLTPANRTNDIYNLPVVVHVIHNGEAYGTGVNITDEQIQSAITALNNDFRHVVGTNGDGAGPDVGIEFCLASRNPQGQPTTGIVRVNGSAVPLYSTQGIESSGGNGAAETAVKALSTWPRESYVNIWVVSEIGNNDGGSGIQGYAYFPFNNAVDGIVVLYNAFGTVGNLKSYTNMNRTLTHEVGHYLGLYHTFNGTSSCSSETDCATQGDRVCDTPATIQATSCSSPACSGTQQVENYMDYTSQTCQDMFTEGQKLRMRTTLESQRTSMLTSMGCMPVFTNDVGVTAVLGPEGTNCPGSLVPQVTLTNFGSSTLTNVTIRSNIDGAGLTTFNWTGSLASGTSTTVNLASITPNSGDHTFYAWTFNPNGVADQNTSNDQSTGTFSVAGGSAATLDIITDYYGAETTWVINDNNNATLMSGGPYANGQQGVHHYTPVCLPTGCYTLVLTDAYGDGQGFTNGSFNLTSASGTVLASGAGNWGETSTNNFCITATTPAAPVAAFTIQDQTVCRNAQVDFTSTSTNAPTAYLWTFEGGSPATSTDANPQNITWATAGTYDVTLTVTNAGGTNTYAFANCMTIFGNPTASATGTNPLCAGNTNGSVSASASGNAPYTYNWSTGATGANLNNVAAGTYTVTVTDANGCTAQASSTLVNPTTLTVSGTTTNASCNGTNTGSVALNVTGGTGNKTYAWSNGSSTSSLSNAPAGSYSVTVTDANGCSANQSFSITQPSAITVNITTTAITCSSSNNGTLTASATGGTGNKTYSWNTGATGSILSNLAAGSYTVTATDANACTTTQTTTLVAPTALAISGSETDILCAGDANGSINVGVSGGTGNVSLAWSNGSTGASLVNLGPGSYTVTATDANNCSAQMSYTISRLLH